MGGGGGLEPYGPRPPPAWGPRAWARTAAAARAARTTDGSAAAFPGPGGAVGSPRTSRRGGGAGRGDAASGDATTQRGAVTHAPLLAQ